MNLLVDNLNHAGRPPVALVAPDGGRLLALPSSGRVLALCPPGSEENFLWTHPALATAESASAYFRRAGWCNPGGDRTWLAPEIELFIGDVQRVFETYAVQPALDPGHWTLASATDTELRMTQATRLRLHRSRRDVEVRMEKMFRPAANPLPDAGLSYAGYVQRTTLEVEPPAEGPVRLGLWNLLQLPSPGTMLMPTRVATSPQKVFGEFAEGELMDDSRGVRWEMGGPGRAAKISLKAGVLTGRAGYLRHNPAAGVSDLVVREFVVDPEGDYVDALFTPPHETGWAFQACCVRGATECFNELEYHVPVPAGTMISRDESRVWAFRGPAEAVRAAAERLLRIPICA